MGVSLGMVVQVFWLSERAVFRFKDWRRIATRYDKLATNFLAAVTNTAIIIFWL